VPDGDGEAGSVDADFWETEIISRCDEEVSHEPMTLSLAFARLLADNGARPRGNEHSDGELTQRKYSHHGRQISEIRTEAGIAKAVEERRRESKEAGAHHGAAGDQGEGRREQEEVSTPPAPSSGIINPTSILNMAKTQNSQKQTKKAPLKTPAEKKAAKREKKNAR
jgi:hypothetical protein